jgi:hypothetical protein
MNPNGNATLHRRGGGTLTERRVAGGTLANMIKRFMQEAPNARREFLIMSEGMEYQPAEIQNLAGQHLFSPAHASENLQRDALLDARAHKGSQKRLELSLPRIGECHAEQAQ